MRLNGVAAIGWNNDALSILQKIGLIINDDFCLPIKDVNKGIEGRYFHG